SSSAQDRLLESLGRYWPDDLDDGQKLEVLRICQVCFVRMGRPGEDTARDVIRDLHGIYPAKSWPLNRELSTLLIYLEAPSAVKKTIALLAGAGTQEEQIHYLVQLRQAKPSWTLDERKTYFGWFPRPKSEADSGGSEPVI